MSTHFGPEINACFCVHDPSWRILVSIISKLSLQYLHCRFKSAVPLHLSWCVLRVTLSGKDCPQILHEWSSPPSGISSVHCISCLAHLRALMKTLPHLRQVSAVATVRSPWRGAAHLLLWVRKRFSRPKFASPSALSLPGTWAWPLTHLNVMTRVWETSFYKLCALFASVWLACGLVCPRTRLAA